MRISHGTRILDIYDRNGYGMATVKMLESLDRLGYEVTQNDKTADVEIWFDQPEHWNFSDGPYKVGYHPWESTALKPGWLDKMNQCDEIWTPSPVVADWYRQYSGVNVPVYVYEHGIGTEWVPARRTVEGKFKFFHQGAEAARKGGSETMKAFRHTFKDNNNVELTMKIISDGWKIGKLNKITIINESLSVASLVQLYHSQNVYVYPSWGEGFGLTPLQAMATGMPTITCPAWAPYADFIDPNLSVSSKLVPTPYPRHHPGWMLEPNMEDLTKAMHYAYENYEAVEADAHARVDEIAAYYDWDRLTKEAFENLKMRL